MMELINKRVVVLGIGRSGIAASLLLVKKGANCIISDIKSESELSEQIKMLKKNNIEVETGEHKLETILCAELIVISPGVPLNIPVLDAAKEKNIPIIGELELGFRFLKKVPVIGITGTKGKTTTTTIITEMLKKEGKDVLLAGNIGIPVTSLIDKLTSESIVVAEISSFQLETVDTFKPFISSILNVSSDHMDRYSNIQDYVEAKARILQNQDKNDFAVLNLDNKYSPILSAMTKSNLIYFSSSSKVENGVWLSKNKIYTNILKKNGAEEDLFDVSELLIKGPHNIENAMASVAIASILNLKPENIIETLKNFKGVEHRQEYVTTVNGIKFINNSQGTNIDAVAKSLVSFDEPIILIMGGRSKGADFTDLKYLIKEKVKAVVLIGEAKEEIAKAIDSSTEIYKSDTMQEAVGKAYTVASAGDCVMLSPACSSFDMFKNYEERGRIFKEAVSNLR